MTNRTINAVGLAEIREFLETYHKGLGVITDAKIRARAADAEAHLDAGEPAYIELPSWHSVLGRTQVFEVSEAGIDE